MAGRSPPRTVQGVVARLLVVFSTRRTKIPASVGLIQTDATFSPNFFPGSSGSSSTRCASVWPMLLFHLCFRHSDHFAYMICCNRCRVINQQQSDRRKTHHQRSQCTIWSIKRGICDIIIGRGNRETLQRSFQIENDCAPNCLGTAPKVR